MASKAGTGPALGIRGVTLHKAEKKQVLYELLRQAQSLLHRPDVAPKKQPATVWCHRSMRGEKANVYRAEDGSSARLSGLTTCGLVWTCPVCAAKIAEARRQDLSRAMASHVKAGGNAYLLTFTFPHESDMPLAELLEKFFKARQSWANSRHCRRIMGDKTQPGGTAGRLGTVNSLEVTVGQANGWHPHVHALVFAKPGAFGDGEPINEAGDLSSSDIDVLKGEWVKALQKHGLCTAGQVTDVFEHGLNVRGGNQAAEYIAKFGRDERWGASSEITRGHAKVGTVGEIAGDMHFTPFQLLLFSANGNAWASARFREYAEAFRGKRMLNWSRGLRKALALDDEREDEEIAAEERPLPAERLVATVTADDLSVLTSRNRLGDFHRYVAQCCLNPDTGQQDVDDYLAMVRGLPKSGRGVVLTRATFDHENRFREAETQEERHAA